MPKPPDPRPSTPDDGRFAKRRVALGLGLTFFAAFELFKLPVILPLLLDDYDYPRTLAGGFMSVYALAGLLLSLPAGRAIARRGTTLPVLLAIAVMLAGNLLALVWPASGAAMLAARALEGSGFAVLAIAGFVLASSGAPPRRRALVVGVLATWIPVGQLLATALAPALITLGGWRAMWLAGTAVTAAFGVWGLYLVAHGGWSVGSVPDRERRAEPAPLGASRRHDLVLAGAVFMLWSGQYFAYMTWLPQYLVEVHDLGIGGAALAYALPSLLMLIGCPATGWLLHLGIRGGGMMVAALAVQTLGWWMIPAADDAIIGLVALALYGASAGVIPTCLLALPGHLGGDAGTQARAFGIMMSGRNLGVLIGPVLLAMLFDINRSWALAAPVFGGSTLICLLLGGALATRLRKARP